MLPLVIAKPGDGRVRDRQVRKELGVCQMTAASAPTKLVSRAAREILRPLGLQQPGRSRTWIDDRSWWLIVVEFQPSSWSLGTYLNVGANWLWFAKNHLSFDEGYRVRWATNPMRMDEQAVHTCDYLAYRDDDQFANDLRGLCDIAAQRVSQLRDRFSSVDDIVRSLAPPHRRRPGLAGPPRGNLGGPGS